jgi:acetyl esterase/lipase
MLGILARRDDESARIYAMNTPTAWAKEQRSQSTCGGHALARLIVGLVLSAPSAVVLAAGVESPTRTTPAPCLAGDHHAMSQPQSTAASAKSWQASWDAAATWCLYAKPPGSLSAMTQASRPADWPEAFISQVQQPYVKVFPATRPNGHAVLIIPGGGYRFVSTDNEGVVVAKRLSAAGYAAFVLVYRLPSEFTPRVPNAPYEDANAAMQVIQAHATELGFNPTTVSVIGFSAGGHLAAWLSTRPAAATTRPFATALVYPVVSLEESVGHVGSSEALLGSNPSPASVHELSLQWAVDQHTPPAWLLHAADDGSVNVENSFLYARALARANRPVTLNILAHGGHGFGTQPDNGSDSDWFSAYVDWLNARVAGVAPATGSVRP